MSTFRGIVYATVSNEKNAPYHDFMVMYKNKPIKNTFRQGKAYCTAIGYFDPRIKEIRTGTKANTNIYGPFDKPELAGKIKYSCWQYEEEIRLCGEVNNPLNDDYCLAIKIPDNFDSMISVILCPGFDKEKNKKYLLELSMRGINFSDSVYDPIYSQFISSIPGIEKYDGSYTVKDGTSKEIYRADEKTVNEETKEFRRKYKEIKDEAQYVLEFYANVYMNPAPAGIPDEIHEKASIALRDVGIKISVLSSEKSIQYPDVPNPCILKEVSGHFIGLSNRVYLHNGEELQDLLEENSKRSDEIKELLGI